VDVESQSLSGGPPPGKNAVRLNDGVKFGWEMVPADGGDPAGAGLEFLVLSSMRSRSTSQRVGRPAEVN
jgi:hypothetical protein